MMEGQAFWPAVRTPLPYAEAAVDRCGLVQVACGVLRLVLVADMMAGWCGAMRVVGVFVDGTISCSKRRQRPCEAPSLH